MLPAHTVTCLAFLLASVTPAFAQRVAHDPPPVLPDVKTPAPARTATADEAAPATVAPAPPAGLLQRAVRPQATDTEQAPPIDFSRVWIDEPGDGRTWVRGRTYKASFDPLGATYYPFFGSDSPRHYPVRVSLAGASAGGAPIALDALGVSHANGSVTIDRGPIHEVWRVAPDSAEQTFELAERPTAHGDLALRLSIESELALRADCDGFALDGELGSVHIARATAIDADGRRLDLVSRLEGSSIAIDVPASFVASARFPLVVDPMYTTHVPDGFGFRTANCSVAGGGTGGLFAIAYGVVYTQNDVDVFSQDLFFGQPVPGSGDWVDATTLSWYDPQIAYNGAQDTYLTTATVQGFAGPSEIWCRARHAQTANEFPQQLVQNNAGGPVTFQDVGGDPTIAGPSFFLCVWTRIYSSSDFDIHAQLLDPFGARVGGVIFLENSGAYDSFPKISKSIGVGSDQAWNITWDRDNGGDHDVYGAIVSWDGLVPASAFGIATSFLTSDSLPAPSTCLDFYGPEIWMVAFQRDSTTSSVQLRVLSGPNVIGSANLTSLIGLAGGTGQGFPIVDSDGRRFAITYSEFLPNGIDGYGATVAWAEGAIRVDEAHVPIETVPENVYGIDIANGHNASNPGFGFYGLAWSVYQTPNSAVYCGAYYEPGFYEGFCSGDGSYGSCPCGNTGDFGAGCANSVTGGGVLTPDGYPLVTYDSFSLEASNLPSSAPCLFFQGTSDSAMGTAFGDGLRCAGGTTIRLASKTASGGIATYPEAGDIPISVKGSIHPGGAQRRYQAWYRNAASFCTPASFNTTNGVRVRWLL